MKRGLHFGRKSARTLAVARLLLVVLLVAAALQGARLWEGSREAAELRRELAGLRARVGASEPGSVPGETPLLTRLSAVLASGATESLPPTALLDLLQQALPAGVVVSALSVSAAPPAPSLTLEAEARTAEAVTELQRRMDASSLVRSTSVLDERLGPDGSLAVRLQVELDRSGLP